MPVREVKLRAFYFFCGFAVFFLGLLTTSSIKTYAAPIEELLPGFLDYDHHQWDQSTVLKLDGEWELYRDQLLTPEDFKQQDLAPEEYWPLPSLWWDRYGLKEPLPLKGVATFRLKVKLHPTQKAISLKVPVIYTAYRLWANGELLMESGKVGQFSTEVPGIVHLRTATFQPKTEITELVLQISNHFRPFGGVLDSILIGDGEAIHSYLIRSILHDFFLFSILAAIGLYHLVLFFNLPNRRQFLYFSLFVMLIALRVLTVGEHLIFDLFPGLTYAIFLKLRFLTYYLATPLGLSFYCKLFPQQFSRLAVQGVNILSVLFALFVLFTPPSIFFLTEESFHVVTLFTTGLIFWGVWQAAQQKRPLSKIVIKFTVPLFFAVWLDILSERLSTNSTNYFYYILFFFAVSFTYLNSRYFVRKTLEATLRHAENLQLKEEIKTRTLVEENLRSQEKLLLDSKYKFELAILEKTQALEDLEQTHQQLKREMRGRSLAENMLSSILIRAPLKVHVKNLQGEYLINNDFEGECYRSPITEHEVGKTAFDLYSAEIAAEKVKMDQQVLAVNKAFEFEETVAGQTFLTTKFPLMDAEGIAYAVCGISTDITQLKETESKVRESQELYEAVVENCKDGIILYQGDKPLFFNQRLMEILGHQETELHSLSQTYGLFPPEEAVRVKGLAEQRMRSEPVPWAYESRMLHSSGSIVPVEFNISLFQHQGQLTTLVFIRDITLHQQMKEEIVSKDIQFQNLFESINDGIFIIQDQKLTLVNPALLRMLGYKEEELMGLNFWQLVVPEDVEKVKSRFLRQQEQKVGADHYELRLQHKDGYIVYTQILLGLIQTGEYSSIAGTVQNITSQKKAELEKGLYLQRLIKEKSRFKTLVETLPHGIQEMGIDGHFTFTNSAYEKIFGFEAGELIGLSIFDTVVPESEQQQLRGYYNLLSMTQPKQTQYIGKGVTKQGKLINIQVDVNYKLDKNEQLVGFISVTTDITEKSLAKEAQVKLRDQVQLAHAGRLTALGEMASGMSHELNQPLTILRLTADVLKRYFALKDPDCMEAEGVDRMITQVNRAATIIKNMRTFSRASGENFGPVNLAEPLEVALSFFREQFRIHQTALVVSVEPNLPIVQMDSQKFEQIVVNLLTNAGYAVEKKLGEMASEFQKSITVALTFDPKAQNVVFEIQDNGIGMSEKTRERCMEPFFTTKVIGEGTGLGLSIIHGILREFKLDFDIHSQEGEGCTFRIFFPIENKLLVPIPPKEGMVLVTAAQTKLSL